MESLRRFSRGLNRGLTILGGIALMTLMLISVGNVTLREVVTPLIAWLGSASGQTMPHLGIPGSYELVGFFGALVAALALGESQERKVHVAVDLITNKLPASLNRGIDILQHVLTLSFSLLAAWQLAVKAFDVIHSQELSETLRIPFYPFIFAVSAGFIFLGLTLLRDLLTSLADRPEGSAL